MMTRLPCIEAAGDRKFRCQVRCLKRNGFLDTTKVKKKDLGKLRGVLEYTSLAGFINPDDHFEVIVDTGCTVTSTPNKSDFVRGSLTTLDSPVIMEGVGGDLEVQQKGIVKWEVINDAGEISVLEFQAYYMPEIQVRLFSPQDWMNQNQDDKSEFRVKRRECKLALADGNTITFGMHQQTFLPVMSCFHDALGTAKSMALTNPTKDPLDLTNKNLTGNQKMLKKGHDKLGHIGMQRVQWFGREGWLGRVLPWSKSTTVCPQCPSCHAGKFERLKVPGAKQKAQPSGKLKEEQLATGDRVFSDQYVSHKPGVVINNWGPGCPLL